MTSKDVPKWIGDHWWQLGLLVVWAVLTAASIQTKADKDEVLAIRQDVNTLLVLMCRQYPADSRCAGRR